jgi:hypothetical protein
MKAGLTLRKRTFDCFEAIFCLLRAVVYAAVIPSRVRINHPSVLAQMTERRLSLPIFQITSE